MWHSYAHDKTSYTFNISLDLVLQKLEKPTLDVFRWFKANHMITNPEE